MAVALQTDSVSADVVPIRAGLTPMVEGAPGSWPNLVEMFFDQAARLGNAPFTFVKIDGVWTGRSWNETAQDVAKLAHALREIGLARGDRVVLVSENRPEWLVCDLAIMAAGGITVPAYTTNTERDHHHILENSGAQFAIVSGPKLAKTLMPAVYRISGFKAVIGIDPLKIGQSSGVTLHDYPDLLAASPGTPAQVRIWAHFQRSDTACLIYTSGTGGAPRGVMQHHGAILINATDVRDLIWSDFGREPDVFLSFLPLSHAYEHTASQFASIALAGQIYYAESLEKLASNLEEVRPTIMVVVPRLFEVLRTRITKAVEKQGKVAAWLFKWALILGEIRYEKGALNWWQSLFDKLLDRTVRKKVQLKLGGRMKAMVAGGAPLNPQVGLFFQSLGIQLCQGYGQTEAGPVISCNIPSRKIKLHSVGPPLPHVEVRIADDGEILVRGEVVMHGYWRNEEDTARALQNGWLHTGDIGHIDGDGHIVITDRKKDIIVNDKGDNVSPQKVEGMLTLEPEIVQAMVYGDKRPHLVGLMVPDPEWLALWAKANAKPNNLAVLYQDPQLHSALQEAVDRVNKALSVTEKVRRIVIAKEAFTTDNEMMTPTLKIRRHVIKQYYEHALISLYG
jgi:long-chain acyl-CoA synthetase